MIKIDLHDYYPHYPKGSFTEVPEEVAAALMKFKREDIAYQVKRFRYKAYYSLDAGDGIETSALEQPETPQEIFERRHDKALLYEALSWLSEKQARRVYAHFVLGKGISEIARMEGSHHSSVAESINRALASIETYIEKF